MTVKTLCIHTLGGMRLSQNDESLTGFVSQKKSEALICYLACNPTPHSRQALANLFWGDYPEDRALNNLSVLLSNIKKQLEDHLIISRQSISINPTAGLWVDAHAFLEATQHLELSLNKAQITKLSEAIELYKGNFLDNFFLPDATDFETWIAIERERFQQRVLQTLNTLLQNHHEQANYPEGIKLARKTLEFDELNEKANYQLIYMLALNGQRSEALAQFESYRLYLKQELELEPEEATYKLIEQIRSGKLKEKNTVATFLKETQTKTQKNRPNKQEHLAKLEPLTNGELFGLSTASAHLEQALSHAGRPWLVAIYGMGGLGKTTLANKIIRNFIEQDAFHNVAWISAKQEEYLIADGISQTGRPALDKKSLISSLHEQTTPHANLNLSPQEKLAHVTQTLKEHAHLIVIDNLETALDVTEIVPLVRKLSKPTKFIITSRFALKNHSDIYGYNLNELSQEDTLALLHYEANNQGIQPLANATQKQLEQIHSVVGGNPLALKLVIGQLSFLPLKQVLKSLKDAQGKRIDALYTYMYWQAWNMLSEQGKQLFLAMPTVQNGTFSQLGIASMLDLDDLQAALANLITLSLLQISGDLEEPRYRLHRLTETFLMNEVLKWQLQN